MLDLTKLIFAGPPFWPATKGSSEHESSRASISMPPMIFQGVGLKPNTGHWMPVMMKLPTLAKFCMPSNDVSSMLFETIKFPPTLAKLCNPSNISSSKLFEISRSPSTTVRFCKPSNAVRPVSKIFKLPCTSLSPANAFRSVTFPPATTRLPGNTPPASAAVSAAACKVALSRSSPFRRRASSIGTREYSAAHPRNASLPAPYITPPAMKRRSAADQGRATTSPLRLPDRNGSPSPVSGFESQR
mmetsp:Transcript_15042/g.38257  ORF Transcript_15042/g.38257 Transcript_15042/m.38257 type:complete len:244 (+) Transcript_15042:778-1509(+)